MKTASIPSLRVDPDLRHAAKSVLQNGETIQLRDLHSHMM